MNKSKIFALLDQTKINIQRLQIPLVIKADGDFDRLNKIVEMQTSVLADLYEIIRAIADKQWT